MSASADWQPCEDWWRTSIVEMQPGMIRYRGYPIEGLIGRVRFPAMIWLLLRGELPGDGEARLLGTSLMAADDHGPQAPSPGSRCNRAAATRAPFRASVRGPTRARTGGRRASASNRLPSRRFLGSYEDNKGDER